MHRLHTPDGTTLSWDQQGSGPPLILIHGSFTDHRTNWAPILPELAQHFTVYAIARRGRGESDATQGHGVEDEARDVAAVIRSVGESVVVVGHSYGAQVALAAVKEAPERVRKLVLYEPPRTHIPDQPTLTRLEAQAETGDWERFAQTFFSQAILVPEEELNELQASEAWPDIVAQSPATRHDIRALPRYRFDPQRFGALSMPVTLQFGTESPSQLWATDDLAAVLPDATLQPLVGQAHEAMMTAPELYAEVLLRDLLGEGEPAGMELS